MFPDEHSWAEARCTRRAAIAAALAATAAAQSLNDAAPTAAASETAAAPQVSTKPVPMKKSINLWAFPYPDQMTLEQCLQLAKDAGFDGIELNYDLDNDLSPKSGPARSTTPFASWPTRSASPSAACARSCSGPIR